jgi:choline transporter-like protein 2/4/5
MAAVHGTGFCSSAQLAVKTIVTNVLRVAAIDSVGDGLVFLGKLSVMAGCGVVALLMSSLAYYTNPVQYPNTYLSSPLLPVILSLLIGYVVASVFFNVRPLLACTCPIIMASNNFHMCIMTLSCN